ncbi:MAG TPA: hypothetical protein VK858_12345 [Longimicrobiales bacterium]|nr:hypothetical protein [Longimicrobiales bacterium]
MCAWCNCVRVESEWLEVEEAIQLLDLFGARAVPGITHGICPPCLDSVLRVLDGET